MAIILTDDQKRWLLTEHEDCTRQHIHAWENGTFPGPRWMPVILKITGKSYEEIRAMYPEKDAANG